MNDLGNLKALEERLAQACDALQEAFQSANVLGGQGESDFKRSIADSLRRAWDARSAVHAAAPELKPEFIAQAERHPEQCSAYMAVASEASRLSAAGAIGEARALLEAYVSANPGTFFAERAKERAHSLG
jgi:ApbE superfamily uncharacterized protein (UPF0280 family)